MGDVMARRGFWFEVVIKDDERGLLMRNGRFEELLAPGKRRVFDLWGELSVEVVKVMRAELTPEKALLMQKTHPSLAGEHLTIVQAGPTDVALVSFDGDPKHLVLPNTTRAFWKTLTRVDVEMIDTSEMRIAKRHLDK